MIMVIQTNRLTWNSEQPQSVVGLPEAKGGVSEEAMKTWDYHDTK